VATKKLRENKDFFIFDGFSLSPKIIKNFKFLAVTAKN
jgi:hypothetical protein